MWARGRNVPQRLKPRAAVARFGAAEAVPLSEAEVDGLDFEDGATYYGRATAGRLVYEEPADG